MGKTHKRDSSHRKEKLAIKHLVNERRYYEDKDNEDEDNRPDYTTRVQIEFEQEYLEEFKKQTK